MVEYVVVTPGATTKLGCPVTSVPLIETPSALSTFQVSVEVEGEKRTVGVAANTVMMGARKMSL